MNKTLKELIAEQNELEKLYPQGDQPPHLWSYWVEDKGFEEALEEYYPGTLAEDEEIRTLFYVWKATEMSSIKLRISDIMSNRENAWKEEIGYD